MQVELSLSPRTEYLCRTRVIIVLSAIAVITAIRAVCHLVSPTPARFIHPTGPELQGGWGSWVWHCLPPHQQDTAVLDQCSPESPRPPS